jgi:hypothetical protein
MLPSRNSKTGSAAANAIALHRLVLDDTDGVLSEEPAARRPPGLTMDLFDKVLQALSGGAKRHLTAEDLDRYAASMNIDPIIFDMII